MAHEMYGINDLLKQYPLVEKAFERTESGMQAVLWSVGGEQACTETPKRIIETVVNTIDGTDSEKQALMIGVMYALAPQCQEKDKKSFESKYGTEVKTLMDSCLAYDQISVMPSDVARVAAVTGICLLAVMTDMYTMAPDGEFSSETVQDIKDQKDADNKRLLPNLHAPKLESLYQRTVQKFMGVLDKAAGNTPQSKARPKNHKNPVGPKR